MRFFGSFCVLRYFWRVVAAIGRRRPIHGLLIRLPLLLT